MRRLSILPGLLVLIPGIALAQPADRVTGLSPDQPSLGTSQLLDYLKAVRHATTEVEFETRGASRREFGAAKLKLTATWRNVRGRPVMTSATIRPVGSKYFKLGDHKIYKLTINNKGEIAIDRKGINSTIYKITRDRHGNMILDMPWYHGGDTTIAAKDVFLDIRRWPPDMVELVQALTKNKPHDPTATKHEGILKWKVTGAAGQHAFPFKGGKVNAATNFAVSGAGILRPNGSFQTIGKGNRATLELTVGRSKYRHATGNMAADVRNGTGSFNGSYAVNVPGGSGGFTLSLNGNVRYGVNGNNIKMTVPSGTRVHAGNAAVSGTGRLIGSIGPNGSAVALKDGTYSLDLSGPLGITGLKAGDLTINDLNTTGTISSRGTIEELSSDTLAGNGTWKGDLTVTKVGGRGARGALIGEEEWGEMELRSGSKVRFDLNEGRFRAGLGGSDLRRRKPSSFEGRFAGNVSGELNLADLNYSGSLGSLTAPEVATRFNLNVDAGSLGDPTRSTLRDTNGTLSVSLPKGGELAKEGLPGAPIETRDVVVTETPTITPAVTQPVVNEPVTIPEPPTAPPPVMRKHTVVSGDTLSGIAKKYGVSMQSIRDLNPGKIPTSGRKKDWVFLKDVLDIPPAPGAVVARPTIRPRARPRTEPVASTPTTREPRTRTEVVKRGPDGRATINLQPGTSADIELTNARMTPRGLELDGSLAATVKINGLELTGTSVEAKILGAAEASLAKTAFKVRPGADGKYAIQVSRIPVKVDMDIAKGSFLHMNTHPSKPVEIQVDGTDSYAKFEVVVETGPDGKLRIKDRQLTKVDLLLDTSDLVQFAGGSVRLGGKKTFKYNGRVRFPADGGIQFIDQVWLGVSGTEENPALEIGR